MAKWQNKSSREAKIPKNPRPRNPRRKENAAASASFPCEVERPAARMRSASRRATRPSENDPGAMSQLYGILMTFGPLREHWNGTAQGLTHD